MLLASPEGPPVPRGVKPWGGGSGPATEGEGGEVGRGGERCDKVQTGTWEVNRGDEKRREVKRGEDR